MIRQFTFHKPKEILQPTLWLFLSQACSMLPAILAYMAIYTLGEAFVPPYTLDLFRLITLAALGVGCFVLQYIVELISYYFTYGKAYRDTADKRIAYIQKLRRQPLGFFSSKESGELISSFSNDFANVEYTLCYWLPYPLGVGALLAISIVWICVYDWRMGLGTQFIIPAIYGLYFLFSGSVYVFIFFMILAVVNELIMLGGGYRSKIRSAVPHTLTWMLNAMGSTLTMLLFRDSLVESYVSMGMDAVSADAAIASLEGFWLAPQNIAIALVAAAALSIAGYALGMKMLGKHFKPAGIA